MSAQRFGAAMAILAAFDRGKALGQKADAESREAIAAFRSLARRLWKAEGGGETLPDFGDLLLGIEKTGKALRSLAAEYNDHPGRGFFGAPHLDTSSMSVDAIVKQVVAWNEQRREMDRIMGKHAKAKHRPPERSPRAARKDLELRAMDALVDAGVSRHDAARQVNAARSKPARSTTYLRKQYRKHERAKKA